MQLVTYNIQYGTGKDGAVDLSRIASEIASADVIATQEVVRFWSRSNMTDQVKELTEQFPDYYWVYGPGVDLNASIRNLEGLVENRRRQFGNLVLSKFPILASRPHLLPRRAFMPNSAFSVPCWIASLHVREVTFGLHLFTWQMQHHRRGSRR